MIDNKQEFFNCSYNLEKLSVGYLLTLVLDEVWLENASYPVLIDPTIMGEDSSVYDTYIFIGDTNVNRNSHEYLKVGVDTSNVYEALIKFNLPKIGTGSQVIYASAVLKSYKDDYYPYGEELKAVKKKASMHQITKNWNETTANWNNMEHGVEQKIECYTTLERGTIDQTKTKVTISNNEFDITSLVKNGILVFLIME